MSYKYPRFPSRRLFDDPEDVCGRCKYHRTSDDFGDWHCSNAGSVYFGDYTEYGDTCEEFKPRGSHDTAQDDFND